MIARLISSLNEWGGLQPRVFLALLMSILRVPQRFSIIWLLPDNMAPNFSSHNGIEKILFRMPAALDRLINKSEVEMSWSSLTKKFDFLRLHETCK